MVRKQKPNLQKFKKLLTSVAIVTIISGTSVQEVRAEEEFSNEDVKAQVAEIEESIFASGNHGIDWRLTTDGVLYLGEGTMKEMEGRYGNNYPWTQTGGTIKKVVIEGDVILPEHPKLFMNMGNLLTIENIDYLDTSNVKDMSYMFYNTTQLKDLDLSSWNTSNVFDMTSMFENTNASHIHLENWDVSNVKSMHGMFADATNLETLNLEQWDVSSVKNMSNMFHTIFSSNSNLTKLEISTWDVSNVTNMVNMFNNAKSLKSLNISNWDVSNVKNMQGMFSGAESLETLDLSNWNVSNVENMSYMFEGANGLKELDLSGWDVSKVVNMSYMLEGSSWSPTEYINLSNWVLSGMTDVDGLFEARMSLDVRPIYELDLSYWNTDKLYNYDFISKLKVSGSLKLINWQDTNELREALDVLLDKNNHLEIIGLDETKHTEEIVSPNFIRHEGRSRENVAINVATEHFSDANKVILVNRDKFADAISATSISQGHYPVLYTRANYVDADTINLLKSMPLDEIYILGGTLSITQDVVNQLQSEVDVKVSRIDGRSRYDANVSAVQTNFIQKDHVVIASGEVYSDALYGVSFANTIDAPVILSKKDKMEQSTIDLLRDLKVKKATIIGGTLTLTNDIETQLTSLGISVDRISGRNRYIGSAEVAASAYDNPTAIVMASGEVFSDALVSAPLAQKLNAPILLVRKNSLEDAVENYLREKQLSIEKIYLQGGPLTITWSNEITMMNIVTYVIERSIVPFETVIQHDDTLSKDEQKVIQKGRNGYKASYYDFNIINNKEDRVLRLEEIEHEPVDEIIKVGTKLSH